MRMKDLLLMKGEGNRMKDIVAFLSFQGGAVSRPHPQMKDKRLITCVFRVETI